MAKIKQMPDSLANQIAAGEVVERPASVVKELVENAIDAQSTEIIVELVEAGIQQIKVTDNGIGMVKEDLCLAFLPHATSKIYDVNDLFNIHSLGFRGEALASIASVSKVRIDSKVKEEASANYILIEGSNYIEEGISQARAGTSITVDSLFYNTPARLKHLKTIKTELSHSLKFIQNLSLSYPEIRFRLIHNDKVIFSSIGNGELQQAIANVYHPNIARDLLAIKGSSSDFSIEGYISKPTLTRTNRQYIHWIINGRVVKNYILDEVLLKAYGRQLMIGRHPIAVVSITLDARLVDVNVHPTKQTVRLSKEDELSELLKETVQTVLQQYNMIPSASDTPLPRLSPEAKVSNLSLDLQHHKDTEQRDLSDSGTYYGELRSALANNSGAVIEEGQALPKEQINKNDKISSDNIESLADAERNEKKLDFFSLRYVGQIHGTYLIAEGESGFYLIDQHAAQERIRYENLMNEPIDTNRQQQLLMPVIFNFTMSETETVNELMPQFNRLGIYLDKFGPNSFQLESYPDWIEAHEVESIVRDVSELLAKQPDLTIQQIREQAIIMRSCRGAIKANHYLDKQQAQALIESLDGLEDPYHCPHGRPVFVEFTENYIEKLFKRIQDRHEGGLYH